MEYQLILLPSLLLTTTSPSSPSSDPLPARCSWCKNLQRRTAPPYAYAEATGPGIILVGEYINFIHSIVHTVQTYTYT